MTANATRRRTGLVTGLVLAGLVGQRSGGAAEAAAGDPAMRALTRAYAVEFLRRNPTVNTYLGGAGLDASLREVDGRLRDHAIGALEEEDRWLTLELEAFRRLDPRTLSANLAIDREVAMAQIRFLLHQHQVRRYQERALDTYTDEPFRAIDWQMQGMTATGPDTYGTSEEWTLLVARLSSIPRYLQVARAELEAGLAHDNTPDMRMLVRNGLETTDADATFFETTLPKLADDRLKGRPERAAMVERVRAASRQAAAAYRLFHDFIAQAFFELPLASGGGGPRVKARFSRDRFAMGEAEYDWALINNFRISKTAAVLFRESWPVVQQTRREMIALAQQIARTHGWAVPAGAPTADGGAIVRAVFAELSRDYPKSDVEMIGWYRDAAFRLVDYARRTGLFDLPADYRLEVVETPPPMRASLDGAAYYPAPPFKTTGVGRFYVTPTGNLLAELQENNRASIADLSAHEGFPGHDWNYKVATQYRDGISAVRWLTPGAVEDSSSMWQDSLAAEGWALYAEALMAEPMAGAPTGFYTPEERLYQLKGKLYRDLRVRVDTGIHTGRLSYGQAVDLFSEIVDFLPGSCAAAATGDGSAPGAPAKAVTAKAVTAKAVTDATKRASCRGAESAIFRYSKWPTQAITYRLGRDQIFEMRRQASLSLGSAFSAKRFHLLYLKQGTIPPGYFRAELLRQVRAASASDSSSRRSGGADTGTGPW
jgi:uncharacterized protein (DUF885 family)